MDGASLKIVRCPAGRVAEALGLVLSDITPSQRQATANRLLEADHPAALEKEPLFIALLGDDLRGAAWGQRESGSIAFFWPPRFTTGNNEASAIALAQAVVNALDDAAVEMTQALLRPSDQEHLPALKSVGFNRLTELLYLSCEAKRFPSDRPATKLEFESYGREKRQRLATIIGRTYDQTLDCVGLEGMRSIDEVITGYEGTGVHRPELWQFVRHGGEDVGILLLTDHPPARQWELIYMGLATEVRGRGWGTQIAQFATWLARRAGVERIVLAVDAANAPAKRMYEAIGFETWDRRTVYVRFPAGINHG